MEETGKNHSLRYLGTVVKPHGIDGEFILDMIDLPAEERPRPGDLLCLDSGEEFVMERLRPHQGRWIVDSPGVPDRNGAEDLRGRDMFYEPDPRESGEADDLSVRDLTGSTVHGHRGERLGEVRKVRFYGPNPVLEISMPDGDLLKFPLHEDLVQAWDPGSESLRLRLPRGWENLRVTDKSSKPE